MTFEEQAIRAAKSERDRLDAIVAEKKQASASFINEQYLAANKAGLAKVAEWFKSMDLDIATTSVVTTAKSHYSFMPYDQQPARADGYTVWLMITIIFEWRVEGRKFTGTNIYAESIPYELQSGYGFDRQEYQYGQPGFNVEVLVGSQQPANTLVELGAALLSDKGK